VFTGEYRHTVDDKGRIAVPVKFRAQLDPGSMVSGWLDDCLAIHTKAGWEELSEKVAALPFTDPRSRSFQRFVFSTATDAEMDKQGRILLPAYLRQSVGLTGEAVLVEQLAAHAGLSSEHLRCPAAAVVLRMELMRDAQLLRSRRRNRETADEKQIPNLRSGPPSNHARSFMGV
jgi:MraZ protein